MAPDSSNRAASHAVTSATVPCVTQPLAYMQSPYRFLVLEKTLQEIAEKKRMNQALVPQKKAMLEYQVNR